MFFCDQIRGLSIIFLTDPEIRFSTTTTFDSTFCTLINDIIKYDYGKKNNGIIIFFRNNYAGVMIYLQEEKIYNSISKSYLFI